ncbi:MAG: AAA family ATPase [Beijerinckiaceae bacterium]|nr:AAA family ATPase [Beijerinckiaceae bacterium]
MIKRLCISGYRSLRDVRLELDELTVVTGANGSGKSSLYRSLRLLADVAQGRAVPSLAIEGGLSSVLWAGPETLSQSVRRGVHPVQGTVRKGPVSLKLGFSSEDYGYAIDLGLPPPVPPSRFDRDPEIKIESLWAGLTLQRSNVFASRAGPSVRIRDEKGAWTQAITDLKTYDSMLTHCGDPRAAPELLNRRESMRAWRFYDHFRTDSDAPARRRQVGTRTPILASDGSDLAAAIGTIQEIGDIELLDSSIADAFPGGSIDVCETDGYFEIEMRQHGLLRPLKTSELSDGTLRYLLLIAALLTPRPPRLMILNEPETSLHPDLLPPLARLIVAASARSQIIVVSHAAELVASLREQGGKQVVLAKELGETVVMDDTSLSWTWPSR